MKFATIQEELKRASQSDGFLPPSFTETIPTVKKVSDLKEPAPQETNIYTLRAGGTLELLYHEEIDNLVGDIDDKLAKIRGTNHEPEEPQFDFVSFLAEIRLDVDNKVENVLERIKEVEDRIHTESLNQQKPGMTQGEKKRLADLETKLAELPSAPTIEIPVENDSFPNEEFKKYKKLVEDRFNSLDLKLNEDNKGLLDSLSSAQKSIQALESVRHVSPASHESHTKDLMELNEKVLMIYGIENKLKDLTEEKERLESKTEKADKDFTKLLEILDTKVDEDKFTVNVRETAQHKKEIDDLKDYANELQGEIFAIKNDTGPDYEKMISTLQKQVNQNYDVGLVRTQHNEKELEKINSKIMSIRSTAESADTNTIKNGQNLEGIQKKLNALDEAFNSFLLPKDILNNNGSSGELDALKETLSNLRKEFFRFKDEVSTNFSVIGDTLSSNADKHDLKEFEKRLQDKIDKNLKNIMRNKNDIRRHIRELEEKIKNFNFNSDQPITTRDDAMLARKHEGWKCAS